jgi:iron complex outermembrane receptor protein
MYIPRSKSLLLATLLFCWTAIAAVGQVNSGAITGSVQDSSGKVLIGAKVVVEPSDRQAVTDDNGQFRISNLAAGRYTLSASYVGFASYTAPLDVVAGQTANVTAVFFGELAVCHHVSQCSFGSNESDSSL